MKNLYLLFMIVIICSLRSSNLIVSANYYHFLRKPPPPPTTTTTTTTTATININNSNNNNNSNKTDSSILTTDIYNIYNNKQRHHDYVNNQDSTNSSRSLQQQSTKIPYYKTTNLGIRNYDVTLGNPLKGLASSMNIIDPDKTGIAYSLEASYVPFNDIVRDPKGTYDWTNFESLLQQVSDAGTHLIPRIYIHYPGQPIALPNYLIDTIEFRRYTNKDAGLSPYYGDKVLLNAIKEFIIEFGKRYDGDKRIAFIQAGIIGFWGEWHCSGNDGFIPSWVKEEMVLYYNTAFHITPIQIRQPMASAVIAKFGYHDDSFTYATLDGIYNGNVERNLFFWPRIIDSKQTNFWKYAPMGGEIHPNNVDLLFQSSYKANTEYHQDFLKCVEITHTTYMKNAWLFRDEGMKNMEKENANYANARMGYNYQIRSVAAKTVSISSSIIDIDVIIEQIGVAPFYYPLALSARCSNNGGMQMKYTSNNKGIEKLLIDQFTSISVTIMNIPATSECLNSLSLTLDSEWVDNNKNPIKFAQGTDGIVKVKIPLPPPSTIQPVALSTTTPVLSMRFFFIDTIKGIQVKEILNGQDIYQQNVGKSLSIRADIIYNNNNTATTAPVRSVTFSWIENGATRSYTNKYGAPYSMLGSYSSGSNTMMDTKYNTVKYLATPGSKYITVIAQDANQKTLSKRILMIRLI